jgi:TonB family protein
MHITRWIPAALLAAAIVSSAPSGAQAGDRPPLTTLLDSASLHAQVATLPVSPPEQRHGRYFWVEYDSLGQPEKVTPAFARLAPEYAQAIMPLLRASMRKLSRRAPYTAIIEVGAGPSPLIGAPVLERTAPRLIDRRRMQESVAARIFLYARRHPEFNRHMSFAVEVTVNEDGSATTHRMTRSTGAPLLDRDVMRIVRDVRFEPGTLDGLPAPTLVWVPMSYDPG